MWWPVSNSGVTDFQFKACSDRLIHYLAIGCLLAHRPTHSPQRKAKSPGLLVPLNLDAGVIISIWLTCYGLRFVEQRPGDQSGTYQDLFKR